MENNNENRSAERKKLVDELMSQGYLIQKKVANALLKVPRHNFLPPSQQPFAYDDTPLEIGCAQTISAPHMVAIMTEALDVEPTSRILEIGTGFGYQAAILAELATHGQVYTLERIPEVSRVAKKNLSHCNYPHVSVICADGTRGYPEEAPYDRIIVTAAAPKIPVALISQLRSPGKLLIPVGSRRYQELLLAEKVSQKIKQKNLGGCVFVPLLGKDGW